MTNPDRAPTEIIDKANAISVQMSELVLASYAEGARAGVAAAANYVDLAVVSWKGPDIPDIPLVAVESIITVLEALRDAIRLQALQIETPTMPKEGDDG